MSWCVLFVHTKEFWRTNLPKSNVPEGHLCVSLDTLKLRPQNVRWNRIFVLQYILYACTNVTKRVNRENKCKEEKRWKAKNDTKREHSQHSTILCQKLRRRPTSLFLFIETTIKAKPSHRRSNEYSLWSSFTGCTGHIIYHGITFYSCTSNFKFFFCSNTSIALCA